jgi:hypothetical protein
MLFYCTQDNSKKCDSANVLASILSVVVLTVMASDEVGVINHSDNHLLTKSGFV